MYGKHWVCGGGGIGQRGGSMQEGGVFSYSTEGFFAFSRKLPTTALKILRIHGRNYILKLSHTSVLSYICSL